MGTNLMEARN